MPNLSISLSLLAIATTAIRIGAADSLPFTLDPHSQEILRPPVLSEGSLTAGTRVKITAPEFSGTDVFHTLYLPPSWTQSGKPWPIIFEYTGNYFPKSGSTGEVEDAGLGFGLSGGRYIWASLPYISPDHQDNETTWWGDIEATANYAKQNVPRIIKTFNADPKLVFLCGFSRGAIGVNFIGLHDDEIAQLWAAFVTHDHFDGVWHWGNTAWGSPLESYRAKARIRLERVKGRPYLVCQNGANYGTESYLMQVLPSISNFTFNNINATEILGPFPNAFAKTGHNDTWAYKPSRYRTLTWQWMNEVVTSLSSNPTK